MERAEQPAPPAAITVADARAAGWTRAERDAWGRPFHGIRAAPAEALDDADEHLHRLRAFAAGRSDAEFFSHVSAAVAWGLPLPRPLRSGDIDVSVLLPARSPRGRGVRGHALEPRMVRVTTHPELGFPLTDPATTWALLGAIIRDPYDLVAVGDAIVRSPQHPHDPPALGSPADLRAAAYAGRRVGIGAVRAALERVCDGASSVPETWVRLVLVDAGLPEPVLGYEVRALSGAFLARVDLAYPRWRIAVEYEGAHHLTDSAQWTRDIQRYERLAAAGWTVIRITRDDLFVAPWSIAARVRRAIATAS